MKPEPDGGPCPSCLEEAPKWGKRREWIQRLRSESVFDALSQRTNEPICDDCAAAETMTRLMSISWDQARVAIGNARSEMLRLPGTHMGDPLGTMRVSLPGEFEAHMDWIEAEGLDL